MESEYLDSIFSRFSKAVEKEDAPLPSVSLIAEEDNDPYRILVATIISLRTRDSVTFTSSKALFERAKSFEELAEIPADEIAEIIKPAGFYKRKGQELKKIAEIVINEYKGKLPHDMEALLSLPGVGIKTASLVLNLGFNIDALCVDCHVHEIVNRLGWVSTKSPEETEKELRKKLPKRFWIPLNELLVRYGQYICLPISPYCSKCPENETCPKIGVQKSR